jgi:hypothetical protein
MREMKKKTSITADRKWWDKGINFVTGYKISPKRVRKNPNESKYFDAYPSLNM